MKRIVCDTNVILSGLLWKGAPRELLAMADQGKVRLFTTRALLDELDRVLHYPKLAAILVKSGVARPDILRWMVRHSAIIIPKPLGDVAVKDDPSDDNVLACAVTALADVVVSGDRHLRDLGSFRSIPILTASQMLRKID